MAFREPEIQRCLEGLGVRCAAAWSADRRLADRLTGEEALRRLFDLQETSLERTMLGLDWRRDALGKPFVIWDDRSPLQHRHTQVSNSHDGGFHVVLAACNPRLVGLGVDLVYLPRLRRPGRDCRYLLRFARRFMGESEFAAFTHAARHDDEEALRIRAAAHFSLMESLSKACGTGLRLGIGLGKTTSLPPHTLGVLNLEPEVECLFAGQARQRLAVLEVSSWRAVWTRGPDYLLSAAALFGEPRPSAG